jgi:hypothetical protein
MLTWRNKNVGKKAFGKGAFGKKTWSQNSNFDRVFPLLLLDKD